MNTKQKLASLYFGQKIINHPEYNNDYLVYINNITLGWLTDESEYRLILKSLSEITDEDVIHIARVCHQVPNSNFEIKRQDDIIHATNIDNVGIERHICINFKYATINCNMRIPDDNDKLINYKVNIAEIHMNASRVVGYIQSVDYLRSKGYALPYNDLSIDELIKKRWIEIK